MKQITDMTQGKPSKLILTFALPLILTNVGQQLYMIVDAAIVGRGVGVKALAAVGSADWTYWLILWTVTGLTQGFATFVARHFGKQDYEKMNKTIAMSTILCAVIGAILTILGLIAVSPLLILLKTPMDIIEGAKIYLYTMISGTLVVAAYNMSASILRAFGDGKSPLYAMMIAALLNVGLDCLFVLVFRWGIFGAALASVLAQFVSFLYCLYQIKKIQCVRLEKNVWKLDYGMLKKLLMFGFPIALQYIVIAVSGIILQSTINVQGSIFIAGYTATNKLYGLLESTAISLGIACSTFFAQNFGAGNKERVRLGVRTGAFISVMMSVGITVIMLVFGKNLLQMFFNARSSEGALVLQIANRYLMIMSVSLVILYLIHIYRNAMQAIGNSFWSMISGFAECAVRIIMAKMIVNICGSSMLFYIEPAAWIGALLFIMIPYYWYQRKHLC